MLSFQGLFRLKFMNNSMNNKAILNNIQEGFLIQFKVEKFTNPKLEVKISPESADKLDIFRTFGGVGGI